MTHPKVGKGWRWIKAGCIVKSGDEYFDYGNFSPTNRIGLTVTSANVYRRRIAKRAKGNKK